MAFTERIIEKEVDVSMLQAEILYELDVWLGRIFSLNKKFIYNEYGKKLNELLKNEELLLKFKNVEIKVAFFDTSDEFQRKGDAEIGLYITSTNQKLFEDTNGINIEINLTKKSTYMKCYFQFSHYKEKYINYQIVSTLIKYLANYIGADNPNTLIFGASVYGGLTGGLLIDKFSELEYYETLARKVWLPIKEAWKHSTHPVYIDMNQYSSKPKFMSQTKMIVFSNDADKERFTGIADTIDTLFYSGLFEVNDKYLSKYETIEYAFFKGDETTIDIKFLGLANQAKFQGANIAINPTDSNMNNPVLKAIFGESKEWDITNYSTENIMQVLMERLKKEELEILLQHEKEFKEFVSKLILNILEKSKWLVGGEIKFGEDTLKTFNAVKYFDSNEKLIQWVLKVLTESNIFALDVDLVEYLLRCNDLCVKGNRCFGFYFNHGALKGDEKISFVFKKDGKAYRSILKVEVDEIG